MAGAGTDARVSLAVSFLAEPFSAKPTAGFRGGAGATSVFGLVSGLGSGFVAAGVTLGNASWPNAASAGRRATARSVSLLPVGLAAGSRPSSRSSRGSTLKRSSPRSCSKDSPLPTVSPPGFDHAASSPPGTPVISSGAEGISRPAALALASALTRASCNIACPSGAIRGPLSTAAITVPVSSP